MTKIFTDSIFYDYNYILPGEGAFQSKNIVRLQPVLTLYIIPHFQELYSEIIMENVV